MKKVLRVLLAVSVLGLLTGAMAASRGSGGACFDGECGGGGGKNCLSCNQGVIPNIFRFDLF